MTLSEWSRFFIWLPIPPVFLQAHPSTIGITATMIHSYLVHLQGLTIYLTFPSLLFSLCSALEQQYRLKDNSLLLLIINTSWRLLIEIRCYFCINQSHWILCIVLFKTDSIFCMYYLVITLNLTFLHDSHSTPWTPFVLVCASLLHSIQYDKTFDLLHINDICHSVAYNQISLKHNWSL